MKRHLILATAALSVALSAHTGETLSPQTQAGIARALLPSLVQVEFELQPDRGDAPQGAGLMEKCPNCGNYHVDVAAGLLEEDRPLTVPGCLLSSDTVLIPEVLIHPRFVRAITVRAGDEAVSATVAARAVRQSASLLRLEAPLAGVRPQPFDASARAPYAVASFRHDAVWTVHVQPLPTAVVTREDKPPFIALASAGLICTAEGVAVGAALNNELPLDDSWRGNPATVWEWHTARELAAQEALIRERANRAILRVQLRFRTPPQAASDPMFRRYGLSDSRDETSPERECLGVLLPDNQVLVLASLRPDVTARLERIVVYPPEGATVEARFTATLKDHGALLVTLEQPLPGAVVATDLPLLEWPVTPLWLASVQMRGDLRMAHFEPARVEQIERGRKRRLFPGIRQGLPEGFLFDREGRLLAFPVPEREKPSARQRYYYEEDIGHLTPLAHVTGATANLAGAADPSNVPLSEEEAGRLAWAGIELQAMTPELARANGVAHQTRDGETGALVTAVHPGSPAANGGVEPGWILLRIRPEGKTTPIDIQVEQDHGLDGMGGFPWEELDQVPAEYFDRLPAPWPSAESSFNQLLSQIGRGSSYTAAFFAEGKVVERDFIVVAGPAHYESAPRYKSEVLGLTVKDLTFEVRRFLSLGEDDPGVVVAKIEPGGRAAVAGIRPYEVITQINDQPMRKVGDFEEALAAGGDFRLTVKRMSRGRVVNLRSVPGQ